MQYETKTHKINTNESTHSEMGPVWQNPMQRTVRTAHLSVLMSLWLCTASVHNTTQNSSDNLPLLPPDNHHSSSVMSLIVYVDTQHHRTITISSLCMLNVAARVVSGTHKFDRGLSRLLHTELHWLNVSERVAFKLGLMVFNCLHNQAPQYFVDLCQSVSSVASR